MFDNITTFQWILFGFLIVLTWGLAKNTKWARETLWKIFCKLTSFIWKKITGEKDE